MSVMNTTRTVENESVLRVLRNKQLKNLFLHAPVAMCILTGPNFIVDVANDRMLQIWGKTAKQMLDQPLFDGLADAKEQGFEQLLANVYQTGNRVSLDEIPVNLSRKGKTETVVVKLVYEALREENGLISGVMVVAHEITEEVANRKRIEENEARLRLAIETTKLGTWDYNVLSDVLTWSEECRKIYDLPPTKNVDFALFSSLIYPADKDFAESTIQDTLNSTGPGNYNIMYRIHRFSDRKIRWICATGKVFRNDFGQAERFIGTVLDITERKELEDKLRESEMRARLGIEVSHMGTFDWDISSSIFHYSDTLVKIFGFNEVNGLDQSSFVSRIHPDDLAIRLSVHEAAFETGILFYEARLIIPGIGIRWVRINGKIVYDDDLKPLRMYGTALDVTDHKTYSEKLEREVADRTIKLQLKNHELEQFASIASHDLQEPLRKIQTFSEGIKRHLQDEVWATKYLDKINHSAVRMRDLIKSILNYSRIPNDQVDQTDVDLNKIVAEILIDFELLIEEKNATVTFEGLPTVTGNALQLSQLFANLISNALKFTENKPHIVIKSKLIATSDVRNQPDFLHGKSYFEILIEDNGIGFDQRYSEKIFTIFQRLHAKEHYSGTGIGLALCKRIVENHRGYIAAESTSGKGSTFYVYLPC